jgi:hypothetical protein
MGKRVKEKKAEMRVEPEFNKKKLLLTFNNGSAINKLYPDSLIDLKEMMIRDSLIVLFKINRIKHFLENFRRWKSHYYRHNYILYIDKTECRRHS